MDRTTFRQGLVWASLITVAVIVRLEFRDIPNFAPVAAVALFAGYFFRSRTVAVLVPLLAMSISDLWVGGYQPALMVTVYGALAMPALWHNLLQRHFQLGGSFNRTLVSLASLLSCGVAASVLFFVATNGMTWLVTPWYDRSLSGLVSCYAAALPFFRYTLAGDLCFATALFGGYAIVRHLFQPARASVRVLGGTVR